MWLVEKAKSFVVKYSFDLQTRENSSTADFVSQMNNIKAKDGFSKILFSSVVKKVSMSVRQISLIYFISCTVSYSCTLDYF
jgi:hypothetical protein